MCCSLVFEDEQTANMVCDISNITQWTSLTRNNFMFKKEGTYDTFLMGVEDKFIFGE